MEEEDLDQIIGFLNSKEEDEKAAVQAAADKVITA